MTNLESRVGAKQTFHVKIPFATRHFTVFALEIGYVPLQQQDSHLMSFLGIAHIAQNQLQSKLAQENSFFFFNLYNLEKLQESTLLLSAKKQM